MSDGKTRRRKERMNWREESTKRKREENWLKRLMINRERAGSSIQPITEAEWAAAEKSDERIKQEWKWKKRRGRERQRDEFKPRRMNEWTIKTTRPAHKANNRIRAAQVESKFSNQPFSYFGRADSKGWWDEKWMRRQEEKKAERERRETKKTDGRTRKRERAKKRRERLRMMVGDDAQAARMTAWGLEGETKWMSAICLLHETAIWRIPWTGGHQAEDKIWGSPGCSSTLHDAGARGKVMGFRVQLKLLHSIRAERIASSSSSDSLSLLCRCIPWLPPFACRRTHEAEQRRKRNTERKEKEEAINLREEPNADKETTRGGNKEW